MIAAGTAVLKSNEYFFGAVPQQTTNEYPNQDTSVRNENP